MRIKLGDNTYEPSADVINAYLKRMGLKPMGESGTSQALGEIPGGNTNTKMPAQPKWKWSWEPTNGLFIWAVDPKYGQPHHIEMTGPNFWQLAQGRVYTNGEYTEITVWEDRGPENWQDAAVEDVEQWLAEKDIEVDDVLWLSEGGYYRNMGDKPSKKDMIATYFGVDWDKIDYKKKMSLWQSYDSIIQGWNAGEVPAEYAPDPIQEHLDLDDQWLQSIMWEDQRVGPRDPASAIENVCPTCNGEGVTQLALVCPTCHGTGIIT